MNKEFSPQEIENLKKLLKSLKEPKISEDGRGIFFSKLKSMPQRKKRFSISRLKEQLYTPEEILGKIQDAFARPVPAYIRVGALVALLAFIYSYGFIPQAPVIHNLQGTVKIFDAGKNEWHFARSNEKLRTSDIIKTFEDGKVDVSLSGTYSMRLKRNSEIKVSQLSQRFTAGPARFEVAKGKVFTYHNSHRGRFGKPFVLNTKEVIASALGTDFMIEAMPQFNKTWVGVLDGMVKVTSTQVPEGISADEVTVYVKSRYKTEVYLGKVPDKPSIMMEDEWLQLEELYSIGRKPQVALLISTGPSRTRELLSMASLYISDKDPSVLPDRLTKIAKTFNKAVKEKSKELHLYNIEQFKKIVLEYPNPKYDVPFLLFIGAYYEHIGDHINAIETFEKVVEDYPESGLTSIAQCAIGIIYEEKLNDKEKAKEAYSNVIKNYPTGPETTEALAGLRRLSQ